MFEEILDLFLGEFFGLFSGGTPDILTSITLLLVAILRNRILIKIAIKKITKTENQKMFKQEETPVLDTKQLFKQTAWKSLVCWILALIPASWIAFLLTSIEVRIEIQRSAYQGRGGLGVFLVIPLFASVNLSIAWGVMIYFFNKKWTLSEVNLTLEEKKKFSRQLAYFSFPHVIVAPFFILYILFPTSAVFSGITYCFYRLCKNEPVWRKS